MRRLTGHVYRLAGWVEAVDDEIGSRLSGEICSLSHITFMYDLFFKGMFN